MQTPDVAPARRPRPAPPPALPHAPPTAQKLIPPRVLARGAARALRRSEGLELPLLGRIDRVGEVFELGLLLRLPLHARLSHSK